MEAEDCRYAKRKNGDIPFVYLHPDWEEWSGSAKDKKLQTVTCLDILNTFPEELKEQRGETLKYIFPLVIPLEKLLPTSPLVVFTDK